jgi:hypothetical protein
VRALFDGQGAALADEIGARAHMLTQSVNVAGEGFLRQIDERSAAILGDARQRMADMTGLYTDSVETLRQAVDEGAGQAVASLVSTNDGLRRDLGGVLARLQEANKTLQQLSADANGNLGAIEDGLSGRILQLQGLLADVSSETGRASDQLAAQVETLRDVSSGTLHEVADLVGSLDQRGQALADGSRASLAVLSDAAAELGDAEDRMSRALNERRAAIEGLLGQVDQRSSAITNVTRSFAALVQQSMEEAEARAQELSGALAASAQGATGAVGSHFDRLRQETGAESERIAEALRESYAQITADMSGKLTNALSQFRSAAGELKGMSAAIREELDRTRDELKRGVASLPQETEETTSEMRRVVADQIKALNELSNLVSRSSRAMDVVPAAPRTAPARRGGAEPALVADLRPTVAPDRAPAALRSVSAPEQMLTDPVDAAPTLALPRATPLSVPPAAPAPARPAPAAPSGGGTAPSRNAPEQGARSANLNSLDTIADEIAGIIDGERAFGVWQRYRAGERGVFTRRLYTAAGQVTFDEISRKYQDDAGFRRTVEHYVGEFERLIDGLENDPRGEELTQAYLMSDTGKVYLILAHASGHFG